MGRGVSRPLLPTPADAHLNMMHKSTDGSEMNAGDIPLPARATTFTLANTVEDWLEAMQLQINAHLGTTPLLPAQLAGIWQPFEETPPPIPWYVDDPQSYVKT